MELVKNAVLQQSAYDLLPVKIIINDLDDLALTLNGKTRNITKMTF